MALSKRKIILRSIHRGFDTVQLKRHSYLNTTAWFEAQQYDQRMLASKHALDGGASHAMYAALCKEAHQKYNRLLMQWANGTESKYARRR